MSAHRAKLIAGTAALALLLGGCTFDYLQHSDKIALSAGDAVNANLEAQTTDPASDDAYDTSGLGKDGSQVSSAPE